MFIINGFTTDSQTFYIRVNLSIVPLKAQELYQQIRQRSPKLGHPLRTVSASTHDF